MMHPHDKPANGAGGEAGTHGGHADPVPMGLGFGRHADETKGNASAQQRLREQNDNGRQFPPASGSRPPPVSQ